MIRHLLLLTVLVSNLALLANTSPNFVSKPIENVVEYGFYNYQIVVEDGDSDDTLSFVNLEIPDWLTFEQVGKDTGQLVGIPYTYFDLSPVSIGVTDGKDTIYQSFSITLACINSAPYIHTVPEEDSTIINIEYIAIIQAGDQLDDVILTPMEIPQWMEFDNSKPNSLNLSGTPTESDTGVHKISVKAERLSQICNTYSVAEFNLTVFDPYLSLQNNLGELEFKIFPNPFTESVSIKSRDHYIEMIDFEIIDSSGRSILKDKLDCPGTMTLNLNHLQPGAYFAVFKTREKIKTVKFVKTIANEI